MTQTYSWPEKFSDEVLDYEIDWSAALSDGETIAGDVSCIASGGIDVGANTTEGAVTRLRISGGTTALARLDLLATTSAGQKLGARVGIPIFTRGAPADD